MRQKVVFLHFSEDTAKELDFTSFEELTNALHSLRSVTMSSNSIIIKVLSKILFLIIEKLSWKATKYLVVQLESIIRHLEPIAHF